MTDDINNNKDFLKKISLPASFLDAQTAQQQITEVSNNYFIEQNQQNETCVVPFSMEYLEKNTDLQLIAQLIQECSVQEDNTNETNTLSALCKKYTDTAEYGQETENKVSSNKKDICDENGNITGYIEIQEGIRLDGSTSSKKEIIYDLDGNITSSSTIKYDKDGNMESTTEAAYTYDEFGNKISGECSEKDENGNIIYSGKNNYTYDKSGNLTESENTSYFYLENGGFYGTVTSYEYDNSGEKSVSKIVTMDDTDGDGVIDDVQCSLDKNTTIIPNNHRSAASADVENSDVSYDDDSTKDGEIGDTKQHGTGDCWLLSGINALSYTEEGQEYIKEALDYQNGYTIVHLTVGDVYITDKEIAETKVSREYSTGDDDMIILELAIEKVRDAISNGDINNFSYDKGIAGLQELFDSYSETTDDDSSLDGGWPAQVIYLLTGKKSDYLNINFLTKSTINEKLDKFINNDNKNYVLTASTSITTQVEDINGEEVTIHGRHAYSIKSVDKDTVTVVNPWDSSKEIVISRETFFESFSSIASTDLS